MSKKFNPLMGILVIILIFDTAVIAALLLYGLTGSDSRTYTEAPEPVPGALRIPVLLYHHFQDNIPQSLYETTVTPLEFEEHIIYLKEKGYSPISFSDLWESENGGRKLPARPFIITMDDGYSSNYIHSFPILKKHNTKAAIFIVVSQVGNTSGPFAHFTWSQAREMERSGIIEIHNHSYAHVDYSTLDKDKLSADFTAAQSQIETQLGKRRVRAFAYPGGAFSSQARDILYSLGVKIQLTGVDDIIASGGDMTHISRLTVRHGMTGRDIAGRIDKVIKNTAR